MHCMSEPNNSSTFHDACSVLEKRNTTDNNPSRNPTNLQSESMSEQHETTRVRSSISATATTGDAKNTKKDSDYDDSQSSSTDFGSWDSLPMPQHVVACPEPSYPAGGEFPTTLRPVTSLRSAIALSSGFLNESEKEGKDKSPSKPGRSKNSFATSPRDAESTCRMASRTPTSEACLDSPASVPHRSYSVGATPPTFQSPSNSSVGPPPFRSPKQGFSPSKISPTGVMSPFKPCYQINQLPRVAEGAAEEETSPSSANLKEYPTENLQTSQISVLNDVNYVFARDRIRRSRSADAPDQLKDASLSACAPPPPPPFVSESPPSAVHFNETPSWIAAHGNFPETEQNAQKRVRFARPPGAVPRDGRRVGRSLSSDDQEPRIVKATPTTSAIRKRPSTRVKAPVEIRPSSRTGRGNAGTSSGRRKKPPTQSVTKIYSQETPVPKRAPSTERNNSPQGGNAPLLIVRKLMLETKIRAVTKIQALARRALQRIKVKWFLDLKRQEEILTRKLREIKAQTTTDLRVIQQQVRNSHEATRKEMVCFAVEKEISLGSIEKYKRDLKRENSTLKSRNEHLEETCRKFRSTEMQLESTIAARRGYQMELQMHCDVCTENIDQLRKTKQELKEQEKEMDELFFIHTEGAFYEHRARHTYHWFIQEIIRKVEGTGDDSLVAEILQITDHGLKALEGKPRMLPIPGELFFPGDDSLAGMSLIQTPVDNAQTENETVREKAPPGQSHSGEDASPPLPPALILWRPNSFGTENVEGGSVNSASTDDSTVQFGSMAASLDEAFDEFDDDDTSERTEVENLF